jgi:hypothetical protein
MAGLSPSLAGEPFGDARQHRSDHRSHQSRPQGITSGDCAGPACPLAPFELTLPFREFIGRNLVAAARLADRRPPARHRQHHRGPAAPGPPDRRRRRQRVPIILGNSRHHQRPNPAARYSPRARRRDGGIGPTKWLSTIDQAADEFGPTSVDILKRSARPLDRWWRGGV